MQFTCSKSMLFWSNSNLHRNQNQKFVFIIWKGKKVWPNMKVLPGVNYSFENLEIQNWRQIINFLQIRIASLENKTGNYTYLIWKVSCWASKVASAVCFCSMEDTEWMGRLRLRPSVLMMSRHDHIAWRSWTNTLEYGMIMLTMNSTFSRWS
jgi:hypothetical protein